MGTGTAEAGAAAEEVVGGDAEADREAMPETLESATAASAEALQEGPGCRLAEQPPDATEVEELLRGLSCVVGLHPDQAAGAALDLALALEVPAGVVPCCVYASEFPTRRLANG